MTSYPISYPISRALSSANALAPLGGARAPALPSGAIGVWFPKNVVTSARTIIPNSVGPKLTDSNLLMASRRQFSNGTFWGNFFNAFTFTEGVSGPDGTNDATQLVAAAASNWQCIASIPPAVVNGQTYTAAITVKWLGTGTGNFSFGDSASVGGMLNSVATTSWQRFSHTYTAANGTLCHPQFTSTSSTDAANFAIIDFELFAGSADLHPAPGGVFTVPNRVQNLDWDTGGATVTLGAFQANAANLIQLDHARNLNPFTLVYVTKHTRTAGNYAHEAWLVDASNGGNNYSNFAVGKIFSNMGGHFGGNALATGAAEQSSMSTDLWGGLSGALFAGAARYDGTNGSQYINGAKLANSAFSAPIVTVSDFYVGLVPGGGYTGYDVYAMALYNRALSDAEVVQAKKALISQSGVSFTPSRIVYFQGTSITEGVGEVSPGLGTNGYANNMAASLSHNALGWNDGVPGSHFYAPDSTAIDAILTTAVAAGVKSSPIPLVVDFVLHMEYGANGDATSGPSAYTNSLASYCDGRRAAGWKVVVATILPRDDAGDNGTAFNAARNTANTTIRSWPGVHCDGVSDFGGDATMGPDGAPLNCVAASATIAAGGSGYTNGAQVLTVSGGASFNVTVSGGVVTAINSLASAGSYTYPTTPTNPVATTGGGGTGATLNLTYAGIYFNTDKIHPTHLGHGILSTTASVAINSV